MAQQIKTTKAASVVTTMSKLGTPLGMVDYPAGHEGTVPDEHAKQLGDQGALEEKKAGATPPATGAGAGAATGDAKAV